MTVLFLIKNKTYLYSSYKQGHLHINAINACDCEVIATSVTPTNVLLISVYYMVY